MEALKISKPGEKIFTSFIAILIAAQPQLDAAAMQAAKGSAALDLVNQLKEHELLHKGLNLKGVEPMIWIYPQTAEELSMSYPVLYNAVYQNDDKPTRPYVHIINYKFKIYY